MFCLLSLIYNWENTLMGIINTINTNWWMTAIYMQYTVSFFNVTTTSCFMQQSVFFCSLTDIIYTAYWRNLFSYKYPIFNSIFILLNEAFTCNWLNILKMTKKKMMGIVVLQPRNLQIIHILGSQSPKKPY